MHLGRLAQQHIHGHVHWVLKCLSACLPIFQNQLALFSCNAYNRKRTAFTLTESFECFYGFWRNGQDIALLAFVGPNLFGRESRSLQGNGSQIKAGASTCIVGEFGKSVGQTTGTHIVDGQDRIVCSQNPALVNDFLSATFNFWVASLH